MKTLFVLVGPPSIGKTTFIKNDLPWTTVISRDTIVSKVAENHGLTYNDLFTNPPQDASINSIVPGMEKFGMVVENTHPKMKEFFPLAFQKLLAINQEVETELLIECQSAAHEKNDITIDMTNMDVMSRVKNMTPFIEDDLRRVAIVFNFQDQDALEVLTKASEKRRKEGGKNISREVLERMMGSYEAPTLQEGLDHIIYIDTLPELRKSLNLESTFVAKKV